MEQQTARSSLHTSPQRTTIQSSAPHLNFGFEFFIVDVDGVVLVVLGPSSQQAVRHLNVQQVVQHLNLGLSGDVWGWCSVPLKGFRYKKRKDSSSYLNVVQVAEQRWFLHTKVVRDQSVETIGEIQYLGLRQRV